MKKQISILALLTIILITSCKKEETVSITDEEAAELIAASLSIESSGTITQIEDACLLASDFEKTKNPNFDTSFVFKSESGARIYYQFDISYAYHFDYNNIEQQWEFIFGYDTDGEMTAPKVSSVSNSNGDFVISGLTESENFYIVNGTSETQAEQTINIRDKKIINSKISLTITDITVNKSDFSIHQGTGIITLKATTDSGNTYSFTGEITFQSDGTIILIINGNTYIIDSFSGDVETN